MWGRTKKYLGYVSFCVCVKTESDKEWNRIGKPVVELEARQSFGTLSSSRAHECVPRGDFSFG